MKGSQWHSIHESLSEITAKGRWVGGGYTDVFVQMKPIHASPVDIAIANQGIENFELAGTSRDHQAGFASIRNCILKNFATAFRRMGTHSRSIRFNHNLNNSTSPIAPIPFQ
jgi:hypothetical protein